MTAKEYLSQAYLIDKRIKTKERQLEALRAHSAYSTPRIDGLPMSAPVSSALEEAAVRILDLERSIAVQISEMVKLKVRIAEIIKAINNVEYETILEMRYLSFMKWDEIAAHLDLTIRYVFKLHGRALELVHVPE